MTYDIDQQRLVTARGRRLPACRGVQGLQGPPKVGRLLARDRLAGRAAEAYARVWADWLEGASNVLAGLEGMGTLLRVNHSVYQHNEDVTSAAMSAAATKIRTRLS